MNAQQTLIEWTNEKQNKRKQMISEDRLSKQTTI